MFKKGIGTLMMIVFMSLFLHAHDALAQIIPTTFSESITIRANPQTPKPGQDVKFTVESFSTNLNTVPIIWQVNGVVQLQGIGERYFTLEGKAANTKTVVRVFAGMTEAIYTIQPATVDIIWQADSYTPPFFKGKAQFPYQGNVVVTAIPDIRINNKAVDRKKLIYRWHYNGKLVNDASGYGKDTMTITGDIIIQNMNVSVTVSTSDGSQTANQDLTLVPVRPMVVFYAESPLYGTLYNRALGTEGYLQQEEISLRAVPYHFSTDFRGGSETMTLEWTINSSNLNTAASTLLLRRPDGVSSGKTNIGVKVTSNLNILQSESQNILINYETPNQ